MTPQLRKLLQIDHVLTARIAGRPLRTGVRWVATLITYTGDSIAWLVLGALLWRFGIGVWARIGERVLFATALTWVVSTSLKSFLQRPGPEHTEGLFCLEIDRHSLPSAYATRAGGLLVAAGSLLPAWGAAALAVWALSLGLSRVALRLHYVGDVVSGMLLGGLTGALLLFVLR